jgi:hypothetical protein
MPPRPRLGYHLGWEVEYDYWQEKLVRAVLWAAKREPQVQLEIACDESLNRQKLPTRGVTVSWKGATPEKTTVSVRLRRWDGAEVELGSVDCDRAEGRATFEVPRGRAGRYHLGAFASNGSGSQGWATTTIEITASAAVETIDLQSRQPPLVRGSHLARYEEEFGSLSPETDHGLDRVMVKTGERQVLVPVEEKFSLFRAYLAPRSNVTIGVAIFGLEPDDVVTQRLVECRASDNWLATVRSAPFGCRVAQPLAKRIRHILVGCDKLIGRLCLTCHPLLECFRVCWNQTKSG